ncbi:hypothetical protein BGZ58_010553 [Dissophora ornata]|nr:hypothetical protein BGZ58_010553 [Dissophora ornata]
MFSTQFSLATRVLLPALLADFSIQLAGWSVAALLQTEKFYDLAGSASFVMCTYLSLFKPWAKENRVLKHGDKRFDKVRRMPGRFLIYWFIQGVWVALTALPVYLTNSIPAENHPAIGVQDIIGFALWGAGFAFAVVANFQKERWRKEIGKNYKRSFISHGLCSNAFHSAVEEQLLSKWMVRLAVFSPIFVTILITRVSGIPLLEREDDRRLRDVVAYWKYKKETSMFVPTWPRSVE